MRNSRREEACPQHKRRGLQSSLNKYVSARVCTGVAMGDRRGLVGISPMGRALHQGESVTITSATSTSLYQAAPEGTVVKASPSERRDAPLQGGQSVNDIAGIHMQSDGGRRPLFCYPNADEQAPENQSRGVQGPPGPAPSRGSGRGQMSHLPA